MPEPETFTTPGTLSAASTETAERDMQSIITQLQRDFKARNALYEEYEDALFYENDVYVPDAFRESSVVSRSPLPSHIVNTVVAALTINRPKVQFQPVRPGDKGQQNAELRSHFFEASALRQEEESEHRWFRMLMSALVSKGEGVLKCHERKKLAWSDYNRYVKTLSARLDDEKDEEYGAIARNRDEDSRKRVMLAKTEDYKRGAPYPIITTDILPETFYYFKTLEGFTFCAEVKEVPYLDTLARYGAGLDSGGRVVAKEAMGLPRSEWGAAMDGVPTLTMHETWDATHCTYWLAGPGQQSSSSGAAPQGTLVKRIKHKYGDKRRGVLRGPYFHALGITTHNRLPHRAGLGILYGFLPLFRLLDSLLTIQSNAAFQTGYPAYKRKQGSGLILPGQEGPFGDDNATGTVQAPTTRVVPGQVLPWDVEPIDQPRGSVVLDKVMGDVRSFIELALPSVVQGILDGDPSGYAVNQASHLARLAWSPIIENAQFALSKRIGFESWMIEECIDESVYVWGDQPLTTAGGRRRSEAGWLSVGPDDLQGVHRYTAKLDPETPSNRVIEARTHEGLVNNRFETRDDAILALGGDPEEIERWWQLEEFKQLPEIKAEIHRKALEKLRIKQQQALMGGNGQADLTQPQGSPGPGGPPGAMNGALGNVGDVFQPGQGGQPLMPTPPGALSGSGPAVSAGMGALPGMPNTQGPPRRHMPLPGEGG